MTHFLTLEQIFLSYGDTQALKGVSLTIDRGELVTLVGPSGCGKSTLLRIVTGLLSPQSGRVVLEGYDISRVPPEKRQVGWVPQNYALFEHLNVFDNVAFGLRHHRLGQQLLHQSVMQMLELCQIDALAQRRIAALSGGQKQRVAVARALAIRPKVLLLDEPLAALDPQLRSELRAGLKLLIRESGVTTLFVTHDQTEALSLADRVAVLSEGKLEQFNTPETLWSRPASTFVARFFGSATVLGSRRLDSERIELLPGLWIYRPGEDEPEVALRRHDLVCAASGAPVTVSHCDYLGGNYTITARHDSGIELHFISSRPLLAGKQVCVDLTPDYTPTFIGESHD